MSRRADYGVAVIGGGPAGIAAALAAAGCGADVLLVERADVLGGNVSQALVHTICGLFLPAEGSGERDAGDTPDSPSAPGSGHAHDDHPARDADSSRSARHARVARHAHHGVPRAFSDTLAECGATGSVEWSGQAAFLPIDPGAFAAAAERLCDHSGRIERWNGAALTRLRLTGDGAELEVERTAEGTERAARGSSVVRARIVIDTTGDANAATLAGVATDGARPDEIQRASCIFRLDDVDTAVCDAMERARATMLIARAARQGRLPSTASSVVIRAGARQDSLYVTLNLPKPAGRAFDPLSAVALDEALRAALTDAEAVAAFLTTEREAFAGARVGEWPRRIGVRETRRVQGLVRLEEADVLHGRRRDDEACVSTWPVELWQQHDRLTFRPVDGPSSVPLGCLVADHPSRRLAVAGRCVSASREALGALRVIGTSMAMGEAAGAAAALALAESGDLEGVDPAVVRQAVASGRTTSLW